MHRIDKSIEENKFWRLADPCALIGSFGVYGCYLFLVSAIAYGEVTQDGLRWVGDDLVGPVRSVREEEIQLRKVGAEWIEGESIRVVVMTFDRDRTFSETIQLKPLTSERSTRSSLCFVRGDGNRITKSFVCDFERRPIDGSSSVYQYDSKGNLVEESVEIVSGQPDKYREVYVYDAEGRKTVSRLYDSDGTLSAITAYSRNRDNTFLTVQVSNATGGFHAKEVHVLDSMGRTAEVTSLDDKDRVISRTVLRYDDHGKRIERMFSGRGVERQEIDSYEYDERGNWIKKSGRIIEPTVEERFIVRRAIEYFPR